MSNSSLELIVHFDRMIGRIVNDHPDRAVELLLREYQLSHSRDAFVAALIARCALQEAQKQLAANAAGEVSQ